MYSFLVNLPFFGLCLLTTISNNCYFSKGSIPLSHSPPFHSYDSYYYPSSHKSLANSKPFGGGETKDPWVLSNGQRDTTKRPIRADEIKDNRIKVNASARSLEIPKSSMDIRKQDEKKHAATLVNRNEPKSEARMWMGRRSHYSSYPYFASLIRYGGMRTWWKWQPGCGGALISTKWFITAASCLLEDLSNMRVRYGSSWSSNSWGRQQQLGEGIDLNIGMVFKHPNYTQYGQPADFALVKLQKPIFHESFVLPLPMPGLDKLFIDSEEKVTLVAQGKSFRGEYNYGLKAANITLLSSNCPDNVDPEWEVCAFANDRKQMGDQWRACQGEYLNIICILEQ